MADMPQRRAPGPVTATIDMGAPAKRGWRERTAELRAGAT